ncbi:MAG TPA: beta-propeller fold lactonase family protein [Ramlibacter sp.]|uniref:beta-propeller fold lactonase family protein n=1 Tax=Ramlibacter sp. TaxID=1917967 RepID=UPI002ED3094C
MHTTKRARRPLRWAVLLGSIGMVVLGTWAFRSSDAAGPVKSLSPVAFVPQVLAPSLPEAPFPLRLFTGAVKTDSGGRIITGPTADPAKNLVGAEAAGVRAGLERFTKILFGIDYFTGRPDPGTRIDPNAPRVNSGSQHWPFVPQPFRSWPNALAVTPDGKKLYVTLPGREGYPDNRIAVVDTATRRVLRWVDLSVPSQPVGTRPAGIAMSPVNAYAVVVNQYANFASVIDTGTDAVLGQFETGFYGEDLVFNANGTRLYLTDRFKDQVRAFKVDPGPKFTQIAQIPTGENDLNRANPRDLAISTDGTTLYVANTLGHTIAVINIAGDANTLVRTMPVGGLSTDVKIAGRWGFVSGQSTNNVLNAHETGHGMPKIVNGVAIRNNGAPLGYTPVMSDATRATTFDDLGTELNVFDTSTNRFVFRYVDFERDLSMLAVPGEIVDLGDHTADQKIIHGSGPEQMFVKGNLLFVTQLHSDKVEVFRINQNPGSPGGILTRIGDQFTGGITPQGLAVSPDGRTVYVANMQTEDVSVLGVSEAGVLTRQGLVTVGVTDTTPHPRTGGKGAHLFATHEEIGLRWLFTQSYSDDGQKSCGHCHWQSRHDGGQWNVGANAIGGPKVCPQNKDTSDNWPEWYEGLSGPMNSYASSCNGELVVAERRTALFPQATLEERLRARNEFVLRKTEENSRAIGRPDLSGKAFKVDYYDMAFLQILWTQNETRLMPNPLRQAPTTAEATQVAAGKALFTNEVAAGGAGCASCHHNGNKKVNGEINDSFQDYNIHEPGVIAETTVDNEGPFTRLFNDYFFKPFAPPQDVGGRQNISSRNTKHLRSFWDSVPRWLHHGAAHSIREILLPPGSSLLRTGERGFNFRVVRTDHSRVTAFDFLGGPKVTLPTEVPITMADSSDLGDCRILGGDAKGPICVSIDRPVPKSGSDPAYDKVAYPEGRLELDQLGTKNVVPLLLKDGSLNPALAANNIRVIPDTHGRTSHLSGADVEAISAYLMSLQK